VEHREQLASARRASRPAVASACTAFDTRAALSAADLALSVPTTLRMSVLVHEPCGGRLRVRLVAMRPLRWLLSTPPTTVTSGTATLAATARSTLAAAATPARVSADAAARSAVAVTAAATIATATVTANATIALTFAATAAALAAAALAAFDATTLAAALGATTSAVSAALPITLGAATLRLSATTMERHLNVRWVVQFADQPVECALLVGAVQRLRPMPRLLLLWLLGGLSDFGC